MEILQILQDCYKNNSTFKKAFCWVGFNEANKLNKPIKGMNKEDEFSCIVNWIMHRMPKREAVIMRFEANGLTYQAKIGHNGQRLCVNKPTLTTTASESTLYDWQGEETYNNLTADKIRNSTQRADQLNGQKEQEEGRRLMAMFASIKEEDSQT